MLNAIAIARAAQLEEEADAEAQAAKETKFKKFCRRVLHILTLPGQNTRSLFIFSEENIVRIYSRKMIEWAYPFQF